MHVSLNPRGVNLVPSLIHKDHLRLMRLINALLRHCLSHAGLALLSLVLFHAFDCVVHALVEKVLLVVYEAI